MENCKKWWNDIFPKVEGQVIQKLLQRFNISGYLIQTFHNFVGKKAKNVQKSLLSWWYKDQFVHRWHNKDK